MWTPRRIVLLAMGYLFVFSGYVGYLLSSLGDIDGLPALPEQFRYSASDPGPIEPPPPRIRRVEERLRQAFGADCPELKWPIQLELNNKSLVVAAEDFKIEEDGRISLQPVGVAIIGKDRGPTGYPEINTLRGQLAYLKFDRPITTLTEMNGRKIIGAEISGNIHVTSNRKSPERTDDLVLFVGTGPLYYLESKHLIWTHDTVHLQDLQTKPKPTEVRGKGMEVELVAEVLPAGRPVPVARTKNPTDRITGIKRVQLHANVDMKLYVDGGTGFPGGSKPTSAQRPPMVYREPEKAELTIRTPGRFQYEFLKDNDVARFEIPEVDPRNPVRSPHHVIVDRFFESSHSHDHLFCGKLELHLKTKGARGDTKPGEKKPDPPAGDAPLLNQNMDILFAHAVGAQVTMTSDVEKLEATGTELIYDARISRTLLRGEPHMIARRENNRIQAKELQITEQRATGPGRKSYQTAIAFGPGRVDILDDKNPDRNAPEKITAQAFWNEKLTTSRDGEFDLLVLTGAGRFVDRENDQMLQGETLKVWLTSGESPAGQANPTAGRKVHHLEAIGNVVTRSKDLNVHDTSRLIVRFRDVKVEGQLPVAPVPGAPPPAGNPRLPPPMSVAPQAPANPVLVAVPNAPMNQPKANEAPRPIALSARNIEAWVVRKGAKSDLERLWCEGSVDIKQAPPADKPKEKGLSVTGDSLSMDCHPEGNVLEVTGDLAQLRLDRLYILGPVVNIDQPRNLAWVNGAGAMQVESQTNFAGDKLEKSVPMTILWKKTMLFTGTTAEFKESIQAEQENALLACQSLVVFFDKEIFLKPKSKADELPKPPGKKDEPAPRIKNLVCDKSVRIEQNESRGDVVIKYQRIESEYVALNALEPDEDGPTPSGRASDGNEVRASKAGTLRLFQAGGPDLLAQPMNTPAPGTGPKKAPEPKLTFIQYRDSMYANSKKSLASFYGQVRVINMPSKDPLREVDLEKLVADMPADALYLACNQMTVLNSGDKVQSKQEMLAKGGVTVKAREFWGRAETVSFNEAKDQVILDGGEDGLAILYKEVGRGAPPQKIAGRKITYIRTSGAFKVDEGRWIFGE